MSTHFSQTLTPYATDIDATLSAVERYLATEYFSLDFMEPDQTDELTSLQQIEQAGKHLSSILMNYDRIDALFVWNGARLLFVQNYNTSYARNLEVSRQLQPLLEQTQMSSNGYQSFFSGSSPYFYLWFSMGEGLLGSWISTEQLLGTIQNANLDGAIDIFFTDLNGIPLTAEYHANPQEWEKRLEGCTLSCAPLESAPFSLSVLWKNDVIYQTLSQIEHLIAAAFCAALVLFVLYLIFLRRFLFMPMNRLITNINTLKQEPLAQFSAHRWESSEFDQIYEALNRMTSEIHHLQIDVYEEQLTRQQTQIELYQLQVRPHFFVNILHAIQCFAEEQENKKAAQLADLLSKHCQYILYSSWMVLLEEELNFVNNYIHMQGIRYGHTPHYGVICPEEFLEEEIPILAIQIMVENALKHAQIEPEKLQIKVVIQKRENLNHSFLCICVEDNGIGLTEEQLMKLESGQSLHQQGESHGIGIDNIRGRLKLIYGDRACLHFSKKEQSGTLVELILPMDYGQEG